MADNTSKAKKVLTFAQNPQLAIHDELSESNDRLEALAASTDASKELLEVIASKEFPEFPEIPKPLEEVSIKNFPAVQKVEVANFPAFPSFPEPKAPIVNVPAPVVNVPAPVVNVPAPIVNVEKPDLSALADALKSLQGARDMVLVDRNGKEVEWDKLVQKDSYRGGAMGPSKINLKDAAGAVISPRAEDGHGSSALNPTYISGSLSTSASPIVVDANNSSTATLAAGATFPGTYTDVLSYVQQSVSLFARPNILISGDGSDAKGSLFIDYSDTGSGAGLIQIPYVVRAPGLFIPQVPITVKRYFRVRYINDGGASALSALGLTETAGTPTTQTQFNLTSLLYPTATKELLRTLDQGLSGSDPATVTRAVIAGLLPDGTSFQNVGLNDVGHLYVSPEFDQTIDTFESTSGWTALDGDTTNIATTTHHVRGAVAITFDKANTAANNTRAGIQKTITAIDLSQQAKSGLLGGQFYVSDTTNVAYAWVRLGTDSSNYNEWRVAVEDIMSGDWTSTSEMVLNNPSYAGSTGNGWNPTSVTYVAVGVAFTLETNTLTGIIFDSLFAFTVNHTSAQIATSVSTPNVNINQVGGVTTATNAGNRTNGTQRVTLANNDILVTDFETVLGTSSLIQATQADNVVNTTNSLLTTNFNMVYDGATWDRLKGDATDGMLVNLGANNDVSLATGAKVKVTDGTDDLPIGGVQTATGVATASGDTTVLVVSAGQTVRIYHFSFVPTTASTTDRDVKLITGTTDRMGWRTNTAGGGFAHSPKNGQAWIEGALGEDVIINLSGADSIRWNLTYDVV